MTKFIYLVATTTTYVMSIFQLQPASIAKVKSYESKQYAVSRMHDIPSLKVKSPKLNAPLTACFPMYR